MSYFLLAALCSKRLEGQVRLMDTVTATTLWPDRVLMYMATKQVVLLELNMHLWQISVEERGGRSAGTMHLFNSLCNSPIHGSF